MSAQREHYHHSSQSRSARSPPPELFALGPGGLTLPPLTTTSSPTADPPVPFAPNAPLHPHARPLTDPYGSGGVATTWFIPPTASPGRGSSYGRQESSGRYAPTPYYGSVARTVPSVPHEVHDNRHAAPISPAQPPSWDDPYSGYSTSLASGMSGSSSSHQSMVPYNNYALNMDYSGTSYSYAPADTNAQYFYEPTSAYEPRQFSSQNTFMNEPLSAQGHSPPPPSRSVPSAARGTTRSSHPHYAPYTHFPRRLPTASTSAAASSGAGIEDPMVKKKRKRADAHQLKVLNEVYDRNPFPPTVEREALAVQLGMTPRSVQIWFQNKRQAARQGGRGGQSSKSGSGPSLEPAPATSGSSGNGRSAPVHHSSSLQIIEAPSAAAPRGAPGYVSSPQVRAQSVSPPRSAHRYPQQSQQQTIVVDPYDDRSRRTHAREDRTGSPSQPPVTRRRM